MSSRMRVLLGMLALLSGLGVLTAAPEDRPNALPEGTLTQKTESLLDEEANGALYGVKEMKEVMRSDELKHEHLMKSLRRSSEKKEGAAQLMQEVTWEAGEGGGAVQSEWEQCRPCLEEACKTFYTFTCRRGFASFRAKADSFFHRVSRRFGPRQLTTEAGDVMVNQDPGSQTEAEEVARIEASFSQLMQRVKGLVGRSRALVDRTRTRLDGALRRAFFKGARERDGDERESASPSTLGPFDPARDSAFLQGVGLKDVLDSFFVFGKSVVEEFGAVVATKVSTKDFHEEPEEERKQARGMFPGYLHNRRLSRDLRRQTSECWQLQDQCEACQGPLLKECPSVREEASQLLEVSREQYEEILSMVQCHADQTLGWLGDTAAEFSWVAPEAEGNSTTGHHPWNVFHITSSLTVFWREDE